MSDSNTAQQIHEVIKGAKRNVSISFAGKLDTGETLTGTPTAVDEAAVLTPATVQVNTAALTINGETVAIGQAVTCIIDTAGAVAGTVYTFLISCGTSQGQTLKGKILLSVI